MNADNRYYRPAEWRLADSPYDNDALWVTITAHIKNLKTGVVRKSEHQTWVDKQTNAVSVYMWEEGNYACDCNRRLFFARAVGEEEDWDSPCSSDQYDVKLENPVTGNIFYEENSDATEDGK